MRLALVVPALNEEGAIAGTLRRCLAARAKVQEQTFVSEMIIVFVNDGSTDRTQEIVDQPEFDEVVKVRFEKNRGYGAAIKAGWQATDAELLGFIDGDGTCDPNRCVDLLQKLYDKEADVVLAGRMTAESEMPLVRRIGNTIFARLLGLVSGHDLTDSASGFRIVRRSSLKFMSPLPDGLHFTPAMSCICLLDPRLSIEEVGLPYKERIGRSKLSVVRDGLRFLFTILFSACVYSPIKSMIATSAIAATGMAALTWGVSLMGASGMLINLMTLTGVLMVLLLLGTGVVVHQLNHLLIGPRRPDTPAESLLQSCLEHRRLIMGGLGVTVVSVAGLIWQGSAPTGGAPTGSMLFTLTLIAGVLGVLGGVIVRVIWAVGEKQKALIHDEYRFEPVNAATTTSANQEKASGNGGGGAGDAPKGATLAPAE